MQLGHYSDDPLRKEGLILSRSPVYFKMEEFSIEQLSYSVVLILGALGGLLHVVQRSRCSKISCCGLASCDRLPPELREEGPGTDLETGISLPTVPE